MIWISPSEKDHDNEAAVEAKASDQAIASIVDSVLADLKPKLIEEIATRIMVMHHGEELHLLPDNAQARPIPAAPSLPRPGQPPGREPTHRLGSEEPR